MKIGKESDMFGGPAAGKFDMGIEQITPAPKHEVIDGKQPAIEHHDLLDSGLIKSIEKKKKEAELEKIRADIDKTFEEMQHTAGKTKPKPKFNMFD